MMAFPTTIIFSLLCLIQQSTGASAQGVTVGIEVQPKDLGTINLDAVLDQQQLQSNATFPSELKLDRFMQTFAAGRTGRLAAIDMLMSTDNGILTLGLSEDGIAVIKQGDRQVSPATTGGGYIGHSQDFTTPVKDDPLTPNTPWTRVILDRYVHVTAGTRLILLVENQSTAHWNVAYVKSPNGSQYPQGEMSYGGGENDLTFQTWVVPDMSSSPSPSKASDSPSPSAASHSVSPSTSPSRAPSPMSPGVSCDLCAPINPECKDELDGYQEGLKYPYVDIWDCKDPDSVAYLINKYAPLSSDKATYGCRRSNHSGCNTIVCDTFVPPAAYASLTTLQCPLE